MQSYILSCCSTADLTQQHFKKRDIHYVCFHFSLNGVQYTDDLGKSISYQDFYKAMREGAETTTSQVNAEEFENYFEPFLKDNKDILHVCLSSGLSGVINSARIAQENLQKKYPERKIYIVDSLGASSGYGLLMELLADLRDQNKSLEEVRDFAVNHCLNIHHWFFSGDLDTYIRGGRISKTAGMFGKLLGICPLLNMDIEGHLVPRTKIRTKKKVIKEIVNRMEENADNGLDYCSKCFISHSDCLEDAQAVASLIESKFAKLNGKVQIFSVGTTIGSHTGAGTVALFFEGKKRD